MRSKLLVFMALLSVLTAISTNGTSMPNRHGVVFGVNITPKPIHGIVGIDYQAPVNQAVYLKNQQLQKEFGAAPKVSPNLVCSGGVCVTLYKVLGIQPQLQQTSYYCGPASAAEILTYLGHSQSQSTLASQMGTTPSGTDPTQLMNTLNNDTPPGYAWSMIYSSNYSSLSSFETDWYNDMYTSTVQKGRPSDQAVQTDPNNSGITLVGWSTTDNSWHFVASDGLENLSDGTADVHYADSWNGYTGSYGLHWTSDSTMEYIAYYGRGLIWGYE